MAPPSSNLALPSAARIASSGSGLDGGPPGRPGTTGLQAGALTTTAPHILVVDDDRRLRDLLRRYLENSGFRVSTAADTTQADGLLASIACDLLVLDVMMPGESGLAMARRIDTEALPVLMLTAMGEASDRVNGLEAGADDYLVKPFEPRELVLRIGTILRRRVRSESVSGGAVRLGPLLFDIRRLELTDGGERVYLTSLQAELLAALAAHAGTVLSRDRLRRMLGAQVEERTVDVQVNRLRRKIERDPGFPQYLQTVRGKGYVLRPD